MGLLTQKDLLTAIEKAERRILKEKREKDKLNISVKFSLKIIDKYLSGTINFLEVVIKIEVKDNNVEQALRVLKRKLQRDGFLKL